MSNDNVVQFPSTRVTPRDVIDALVESEPTKIVVVSFHEGQCSLVSYSGNVTASELAFASVLLQQETISLAMEQDGDGDDSDQS